VKHEEERRKEWKSKRKKMVVKRDTAFVTGEQITFFFSAVMVLGRCPLVLLAENRA
jgi:hypothetical protein